MSYRVGCSGWSYPHWRDRFYPHGLPQTRWFQHYSASFTTVEVNNSFYRTPTEETFSAWAQKAPAGFVYAVKVNRGITQFHKLGPAAYPLFAEFVRRAEQMGPALGPLLLQLPPSMGRNDAKLAAFLALPEVSCHRVAVEFRKADWFTEPVYSLLRERQVALAVSDFGELPVRQVATAPWVYARFHGPSGRYWGSYGREELVRWADQLKTLSPEGYAYFNNDAEAAAVRDALLMRELLER